LTAARFAKDPVVDRALRHSVRDGMAYSVAAGGGETYFSAFALFVRASAPQVALLTTLPPLVGSLAQLLSAWAGRYVGRKPLVLAGAALQAAMWLPILALSLTFANQAVALLLVFLSLYHAGGNFAAPQWTSLMRDLVSDRRRGRYFGYRTRRTTIMSFAALIACGAILHFFDAAGQTWQGFVVVFLIAFAARTASVYHLTFLHEPGTAPTSALDVHIAHWWQTVKSSGALGFTLYFILMNLAVGISAPFFAVYMLRDLEFSYLEFTATTGMSVFVQFLTLTMWGRIADVYGNRAIMIVTSIALPVVPVLWLLSGNFYYLLLVQCASGLTWAGFTLSAGNLLYDLVPRSRRAAYVAFHNVGHAGFVFLGAMVGALLATRLPPTEPLLGAIAHPSNLIHLFVLSGGVRALLALSFVRRIRELRRPRRAISTPALVLRVTGFNAMLGLVYEFIGRAPSATEGAPRHDADGTPRTEDAERPQPSKR
jgi:MFS family permease